MNTAKAFTCMLCAAFLPTLASAAELTLLLNPLQAIPGPAVADGACVPDAGLAGGSLGSRTEGPCHIGLLGDGLGVFVEDPDDPLAALTANFVSGPFASGVTLLGPMTLRVHVMFDPVGCGGVVCYPLQASLGFMLEELRADGEAVGLAAQAFVVDNDGLLSYVSPTVVRLDVGDHALTPGSRLRLRLYASEVLLPDCQPDLNSEDCRPPAEQPTLTLSSIGARLVYGGTGDGSERDVGLSGITLAVADDVGAPPADQPLPGTPSVDGTSGDSGTEGGSQGSGGGLPPLTLVVLAAACLSRRR